MSNQLSDDLGLLFSPGQYAMLTVDKPERQKKPRPEGEVVSQLRILFVNEGDRTLYSVGRKLYNEVGTDAARRGLDALARLPGWSNAIVKHGVPAMTQVTRIVQAACATDGLDREPVDIRLEMKRRQEAMCNADQEVTRFLQEIHTAHPAMRKQIRVAAEMVMKAAFKHDVEHAPALVGATLAEARKNTERITNIKETYRTPKETAQWLIQIIVRL